MATAKTPQVCATSSPGYNLEVVVSGKWVVKHPSAVPTGYVFMGRSRSDLAFSPTPGVANSWTAAVRLPAGRLWTTKVTTNDGTKARVVTVMSWLG
jgi:hypothetical protein